MKPVVSMVVLFPLVTIFTCISYVNGGNILAIMTVPSPSHHIWNRVWMEALMDRGHNLTVITMDSDKSRTNLTYILMERVYPMLLEGGDTDYVQMSKDSAFKTVFSFLDYHVSICEAILQSKGLDVIMAYPDSFKFDLVIYDYGCGPCLLPLLHKFNNPPMLSLTPFNNPPFSVDLVGGHKQYAYTPYFALNYSSDMNFLQRAYNTLLCMLSSAYRQFYIIPAVDRMVRSFFKYPDMPYMGDLEKRTQLMLVNTNPALDPLEPLLPNMISIGGAHIKEPKALPDDLRKFIESSKKGAVLFSLGSNVRSDKIGADRQRMFIEAFRQMPQYHFLWKFESDLELDLPPNVIIKQWMPQNSILAHPKLKAFITHSGGLSTQEASWFGVPLIGMPFFMDQLRNCERSVSAGVAEALDFQTVTVDKIRNTVLKVLETPKYKQNMMRRSKFFRDQPEKPLDRAIWWIEYAIRHPDLSYLRSPTLELGPIRANLVDVYGLYALVVIAVYRAVRNAIRLVRSAKPSGKTLKRE